MSYILYEWDVYNFEKQDNNQKSKRNQSMTTNWSHLNPETRGQWDKNAGYWDDYMGDEMAGFVEKNTGQNNNPEAHNMIQQQGLHFV